VFGRPPREGRRINKADKNDAEGRAQIMRTGWHRPVHVKSLCARELSSARAPGWRA